MLNPLSSLTNSPFVNPWGPANVPLPFVVGLRIGGGTFQFASAFVPSAAPTDKRHDPLERGLNQSNKRESP